MTTNELIEQIGGRERLEFIAENAISRERIIMASALLAVLDAQEKPFMCAISDCDGKAHFDEICVDNDGGLLADVVDSLNDFCEEGAVGYSVVPLYTTPPAASAPDGYRIVPIEPTAEMIRVGGNVYEYCEENGEYRDDAARGIYSIMIAAAPASGGDGG